MFGADNPEFGTDNPEIGTDNPAHTLRYAVKEETNDEKDSQEYNYLSYITYKLSIYIIIYKYIRATQLCLGIESRLKWDISNLHSIKPSELLWI